MRTNNPAAAVHARTTPDRKLLRRLFGVWVAVLCLPGCLTPLDMLRTVGKNPDSSRIRSANSELAKDLAVAQHLVESADYSQAVTRLQNIIANSPESPVATDAYYFLGVTFHHRAGYADAQRCFDEYVKRAPKGQYAKSSQEYLAGLADLRTQNDRAIAQLKTRLTDTAPPENLAPDQLGEWMKLADLYWQNGRYDEAGAIYGRAIAVRPELANEEKIRARLEVQPDGRIVLLTPEELDRRMAASQPAQLIGVQSFTSRRFRGWEGSLTKDDFYHVTGKVLNRGEDVLTQVEVLVTIYTYGSLVLDTKTVAIGRLKPGESRPFSARFTDLDTIANVGRYECEVSYSR